MNKKFSRVIISLILILLVSTVGFYYLGSAKEITVIPDGNYTKYQACPKQVEEMRAKGDKTLPLSERYKDLKLIDVHNHQGPSAVTQVKQWSSYHIDKTVIFGNISEPTAISTDKLGFTAYRQVPNNVYPFFAGINILNQSGVDYAKEMLEKGYYGMGELAAASTYSPALARVKWKASNPLANKFPEIYKLAAKYNAPVLLHIDPPAGLPITVLEKALTKFPKTKFIFAHANVANTPEAIEELLKKHRNLYIDFYAGYTLEESENGGLGLKDYAPLIEKYPDQFMFGTDGGYGMSYEKAALAMYDTIDLLKPETACKISYQNFEKMIETQLPTETQINRIKELSAKLEIKGERKLNKRKANELIFKLEEEIEEQEK